MVEEIKSSEDLSKKYELPQVTISQPKTDPSSSEPDPSMNLGDLMTQAGQSQQPSNLGPTSSFSGFRIKGYRK
jgi:hypothetical protein